MTKQFTVLLQESASAKQVERSVTATLKALGFFRPRVLCTQPVSREVDVTIAYDEELTLKS